MRSHAIPCKALFVGQCLSALALGQAAHRVDGYEPIVCWFVGQPGDSCKDTCPFASGRLTQWPKSQASRLDSFNSSTVGLPWNRLCKNVGKHQETLFPIVLDDDGSCQFDSFQGGVKLSYYNHAPINKTVQRVCACAPEGRIWSRDQYMMVEVGFVTVVICTLLTCISLFRSWRASAKITDFAHGAAACGDGLSFFIYSNTLARTNPHCDTYAPSFWLAIVAYLVFVSSGLVGLLGLVSNFLFGQSHVRRTFGALHVMLRCLVIGDAIQFLVQWYTFANLSVFVDPRMKLSAVQILPMVSFQYVPRLFDDRFLGMEVNWSFIFAAFALFFNLVDLILIHGIPETSHILSMIFSVQNPYELLKDLDETQDDEMSQELGQKSLGQLRQQAEVDGASAAEIDAALDKDEPKKELISLILSKRNEKTLNDRRFISS